MPGRGAGDKSALPSRHSVIRVLIECGYQTAAMAARRLGVDPATMRRMIKAQELVPGRKMAGRRWWRRSEVDAAFKFAVRRKLTGRP